VASPALAADWPQYHRNSARTGVGPASPALSSPSVAWTAHLDGDVYASPLIVAGHVLAATENNTVYSLDLFSGSVVWKIHLGDPVDASSLPCGNIGPVTGITGTPAVDLATGRLYVVAFLRTKHHMLYTLSLVDGSVIAQQDVDPPGSNPAVHQERGALALGANFVYVPFGGLYGDCGAYHGYVQAVPLAGGAVLSYKVPTAREAGIWSPQGATIAPDGSVYVVSGNGDSRSAFDYSNAVIQLSPDVQSVRSYFAPSNWASLNAATQTWAQSAPPSSHRSVSSWPSASRGWHICLRRAASAVLAGRWQAGRCARDRGVGPPGPGPPSTCRAPTVSTHCR